MRLPEIQSELRDLASQHGVPRLAELADEMRRRGPTTRAKAKSTPASDDLFTAIRAYKQLNPSMSQLEVARVFNVNPGRVSEAMRGFRS